MAKKREKQADVGINMTPMIDIVFQLIIFFMLASQFASAEVDMSIQVPDVEDSRALINDPKPPIRLIINMAADLAEDDPKDLRSKGLAYIKVGPINIEDDMVRLRELLEAGKAKADAENGNLILIIRAHRTLAWTHVQQVMTEAAKAHVKDVQLAAPVGEYGATHKGEQ